MKNAIKTTALTIALFAAATVSGFAIDKKNKSIATFASGIYETFDGKINVMVDKKEVDAATTILIRNEQHELIYRETLSKSHVKFGRSLNISQLNPGTYHIEIYSKGHTELQQFEVKAKTTH